MITFEQLKNEVEKLGYEASEQLLYETVNAFLIFKDGLVNPGQDIYALCLEGPPGAGKTEFAKMYTKLCTKMLGSEVKLVDYQCDITTGKAELFEDINISAAIRRDADKVNIPGKIVEAIKLVNEGKKVVLFIDEYDKAREETDSFFLQLLQSGKINSTQHGDLEIKDEYKGNLQVIFCKNDFREELSGPLSRRMRYFRLDYMRPDTFFKVAKRVLVDEANDKVDEGLINLVTLMYQKVYDNREVYTRVPSCSELLIAISDADRLVKRANAPQYIVYSVIIKNMLKTEDDIKTFESSLNHVKNTNDSGLSALIEAMKVVGKTETPHESLNELIAKNIFKDEAKKFDARSDELQSLIDEYSKKFKDMEVKRQQEIDKEINKIKLENGNLVRMPKPDSKTLFDDEAAYVKRGYDIFDTSDDDWVSVATMKIKSLSQYMLVEKLIQNAGNLGIVIYENGILLQDDNDLKLIVIADVLPNGELVYKFMSSLPIIPSIYISYIKKFIEICMDVYTYQPKSGRSKIIRNASLTNLEGTCSINTLIYDDSELLAYPKVSDSIYNLELNVDLTSNDFAEFFKKFNCTDVEHAISASKKVMDSNKRVRTHE